MNDVGTLFTRKRNKKTLAKETDDDDDGDGDDDDLPELEES